MEGRSLNHLPPEILQKILHSLDHGQIYLLSGVCQKLRSVCSSPSLWQRVRFSSETPKPLLWACLRLMKYATTEVSFEREPLGKCLTWPSLPVAFMEEWMSLCSSLKVLRIVGYIFDGNKAKISLLPRKIEKLSFVWCQIQDPDHFFRKSGIESITVLRYFRI